MVHWLAGDYPQAAAFILSQIDESQLRSYVSRVDIGRQRETCQVDYYSGIKQRLERRSEQSERLLRTAAANFQALIDCELLSLSTATSRLAPPTNRG